MTGFGNIFGAGFCALLMALPLRAEPVAIFAASSLKSALDEVIETRKLDAVAAYGGSAAIARQVAQGARADIVILAHAEWMDWLAAQDLLAKDTRCHLLANTLVLAGASGARDVQIQSAEDIIAALAGGRLAVGQLETVPAGQYTAAYLEGQGWLAQLTPHMAQTSNVRLALALVARGETPLGFVYASDVFAEPRVRALFTPPPGAYPAIRYHMARLDGADGQNVQSVALALASAGDIFQRSGFAPVPAAQKERCK